MTFTRITGLAGLGFVTVVVAANVASAAVGQPPDAGADPTEVATYLTEHPIPVGISLALPPLAWLLLAIFGAGAFASIWPVEHDRGEAWSVVGLTGVVMLNLLFASVVATQIALTADAPAATALTGGLWDLHNAYFAINNVGIATALTGFSIGGIRTTTLRPWHGLLGLAGAGLTLAGAMLAPVTAGGQAPALSLIGFAGFGLWLLWVATFGMALLRGGTTRPQPTEPPHRSPLGLERNRPAGRARAD
jgi:hypothetical protein